MKESIKEALRVLHREISSASLEDLRELPLEIDKLSLRIRENETYLRERLEDLYKDVPDEPWWNR